MPHFPFPPSPQPQLQFPAHLLFPYPQLPRLVAYSDCPHPLLLCRAKPPLLLFPSHRYLSSLCLSQADPRPLHLHPHSLSSSPLPLQANLLLLLPLLPHHLLCESLDSAELLEVKSSQADYTLDRCAIPKRERGVSGD